MLRTLMMCCGLMMVTSAVQAQCTHVYGPPAYVNEHCAFRNGLWQQSATRWQDVGYSLNNCYYWPAVTFYSATQMALRCDQYNREVCSGPTGMAILYEGTAADRNRRYRHELLHWFSHCTTSNPTYGEDTWHLDTPRWNGFLLD